MGDWDWVCLAGVSVSACQIGAGGFVLRGRADSPRRHGGTEKRVQGQCRLLTTHVGSVWFPSIQRSAVSFQLLMTADSAGRSIQISKNRVGSRTLRALREIACWRSATDPARRFHRLHRSIPGGVPAGRSSRGGRASCQEPPACSPRGRASQVQNSNPQMSSCQAYQLHKITSLVQ
jgi:hypothetical protein